MHDDFIGEKVFFSFTSSNDGDRGEFGIGFTRFFYQKNHLLANPTVFGRRHYRKCWPVVRSAVSGLHMCTVQETAVGLFKILFLPLALYPRLGGGSRALGPSGMESSHKNEAFSHIEHVELCASQYYSSSIDAVRSLPIVSAFFACTPDCFP